MIPRMLLVCSLGAALFGCAEAPFSVHAQDNDLKTLKQALARAAPEAARPRNGSGHALALVLVGPERRGDKDAGGERTIVGYDLTDGKPLFSVPADVRSRFVVGRGVFAHREGEDSLAIRDAQSGRLRARVPLELSQRGHLLIGLAADDERIYYVTQAKGRGERRSTVAAVGFDGQRLWSANAPGSVGAPAARGGLLAAPFRYQDVVLLDGRTGAELSRIRQKDEEIGFVRASAHGLFYGVGDKGAALLDERSVKGTKGEIAYLSPNLGERVRVFLYWDAYRPEQADFSAFDRNRLLWSAAPREGSVAFLEGLAILHSYRFLFAVDAGSGAIRWAFTQPRQNIMSSDDTGAAVVLAVQDGELAALDRKSGAKVMSQRLQVPAGQQVLGAVFDAAGFAPQAQGQAQAPDVLAVLHDIIFDKDSSFIAVKTFAVNAVASLPGKEATAELLRVVTAEAMPQQVTRAAGEALVARRDREVTAMLVQALEERYDYLNDRKPRGVGILARAAAAMGAREAISALSRQLRDPATPPAALKEVVGALIKLGDKQAIRPLREMILLYRSDPMFAKDADPLRLAGEGLLKLGGEPERRTVSYVAEEPRTLAPIAAYYRKILDETAKKPSIKAKAAEESPEAAPVQR
jgi:outer membrane protein assembly factor BamB